MAQAHCPLQGSTASCPSFIDYWSFRVYQSIPYGQLDPTKSHGTSSINYWTRDSMQPLSRKDIKWLFITKMGHDLPKGLINSKPCIDLSRSWLIQLDQFSLFMDYINVIACWFPENVTVFIYNWSQVICYDIYELDWSYVVLNTMILLLQYLTIHGTVTHVATPADI